MSISNEYLQEPCLYCKKKLLTKAKKRIQGRHIPEPTTFSYVKCQECGRISCLLI